MNTLKTVGFKSVVIAVTGLVAITSFGKSAYDPYSISKDIGRADSILSPASKALGTAVKGDSKESASQIQETAEKAAAAIATSQKVQKWRKENEGLNKTNDNLKTANSLPAILKLNIQKRREDANTNLKNLFGQLNQQPQSSLNPNDFDMSNLHPQCNDGVDFTQFRSLSDQMNQAPFKYLREQAQLLIQEKDKKLKEERATSLAAAAKTFDEAADREDEEKGQKSVIDEKLGEEAQLAGLKQDKGALQKSIKSQRKKLVKSLFTDLIPSLAQIEENDGRLAQISANFADSLEGFRKASYETAIANAQHLKSNCERINQEVGRDAPFNPGSLLGKAYQKVVEFHQGDANFYANTTFAAGVRQMVNNMKCPSAVPQIDALFGSALQTPIAAMRTAQDPNTLVQGAMTTLQAIANAQAQVGPSVKRLARACDSAGRNKDKVQKFVQSTDQAIQQEQQQLAQSGSGQPGVSRLKGGRSNGTSGAVTHKTGPR